MNRMKLAVLALTLFASSAWAVSVQEVIDLSRAQVGDDIVIAKIRADRSTFTLSTKDILDLKNAGVSDKVILARVEAEGPPLSAPGAPPRPADSGPTHKPVFPGSRGSSTAFCHGGLRPSAHARLSRAFRICCLRP